MEAVTLQTFTIDWRKTRKSYKLTNVRPKIIFIIIDEINNFLQTVEIGKCS